MKMTKFFAVAMASTALFASCSKEQGGSTQNGEKQAVQITISREAATRAIGDVTADDPEVVFNDGCLLFTNSVGVIYMVVEIENSAAAYAAGKVGIDALDTDEGGGAWITDVPKAATAVHFAGNLAAASITPAVGGTIDAIVALIDAQDDADGGVENVMLYGSSDLIPATGFKADGTTPVTAEDYKAEFDVTPIAARFEIGEIVNAATDDNAGIYVESFDVVGLFVDNYYTAMSIDGKADDSDLMDKIFEDKDVADYLTGFTSLNGVTYDYNAGSALTAPGAGEAWTYNLFAPASATTTVAMPSLIIHLDNVVINNGIESIDLGEQFLTIKNFYNKESSNAKITNLVQGKIYWIETISFTAEDLTEYPYQTLKDVLVEIKMIDWETIATGYDFN